MPFPWEGALVILLVPFQRPGNCQRALQKVLELALSAWLNFVVVAINQTNLSLKRTLVQYIRVALLQATTTKQRPRSYFETMGGGCSNCDPRLGVAHTDSFVDA